MSKIRKSAKKIAGAGMKVLDPIGYKLVGKKLNKSVEDFTAQNLWGTDVDGNIPGAETIAAPASKVMPTADDDRLKKARRGNLLRQRARSGRQSTILSSSDDQL